MDPQLPTAVDFEEAFMKAAVGMALVSADGRWLRVNHRLCEMVGYTAGELVGNSLWDLTHPDDVADDAEARKRMMSGELPAVYREKRYLRKDGTPIWVGISSSLIWAAPGSPKHFITVVQDIGARRAAEAALRDREALLERVHELARLGRWTWDFRADRPAWSREMFRIFGLDPAGPALGYREVAQRFAPGGWSQLAEAVRRAIEQGEPYELDLEVVRPDGERRWVVARGEAVRDEAGEVTALRGSMQDITQRVRAVRDREAVQGKLAAALNSIQDAVFISDAEGRFLEFNDAFATFHKFKDRNECAKTFGEYPEFLDVFLPDGRLAPVEMWAVPRALRGERVAWAEYGLRRKDTGEAWVGSYSFSPIRDAAGGIIGSVVVARDITALKAMEHEIQRLNANLERRVAERTAELTGANQELESFAYAVSHDLRAPLRAMGGFSRLLVEDYAPQLPEEARGYLQQIELAGRHMSGLVDGILTLSRCTRGELGRDRVDLSALAADLLADLGRADPGRRVAASVEPGLEARGDARMLEVVMRNLLDNAWKYTSGTPAPEIRVHRLREGGRDWICVEDNGAGFDMAFAGHLYQPFQRLHRQDEFPGLGIGLATVHRIIQRHGGELRAESAPGAGATFRFSLPPFAQEAHP